MGLRLFRRVRIAPGLTLNLSKSGGSLSIGMRGARYTVGPRGRRSTVGLPGTGLYYTEVSSSSRGVLLTLVEACQFAGDMQEAYVHVHRLRGLEPDDVVILLSEVELLWEANSGERDTCEHIVQMTKAVENKCHIHTTVLLYKARALAALGMYTAARDVLTTSLRRRKDRPVEFYDDSHGDMVDRFLLLGVSGRLRVLMVCHCLRQAGSVIRIISARKATRNEQNEYPWRTL